MGFEFMTLSIMRGESDWKHICELRKSLTNVKICAQKMLGSNDLGFM